MDRDEAHYRVRKLQAATLAARGVEHGAPGERALLPWDEIRCVLAAELGSPSRARAVVFDLLGADHEGRWIAFRDHFPKGIRRIVFGSVSALVGLPARLLFGQHGGKVLFYGVTRVCKGTGNLKGLFGGVHSYYNKIDGQ